MVYITDDSQAIDIDVAIPADPNNFLSYGIHDSTPPSFNVTSNLITVTAVPPTPCHWINLLLPFYVQDYQIDFDFNIQTTGVLPDFIIPFAIHTPTASGDCYDAYGHLLNVPGQLLYLRSAGSPVNRHLLNIRDVLAGTAGNTAYYHTDGVTYYARLSRVGAVATLQEFSDPARTIQVGIPVSIACATNPLNVITAVGNVNNTSYTTTTGTIGNYNFTYITAP